MGTNTLVTRATKNIVEAVDVNQYFTAITDYFVPRVLATGAPLTAWGGIGSTTYRWAEGWFSGNVEASSFTLNGVAVGTSSDSYWIQDVGNNISYDLGNVGIGATRYFYIGDEDTDDSWRYRIDGSELVYEYREGGAWKESTRMYRQES